MKALIKRGLIIVPALVLAGVMAAGAAMADTKDDHRSWGAMGGQDSYHGHNEGKNGGRTVDKMIQHMSKALDLTDAQEDAIKDTIKGQHKGQHNAIVVANRQAMAKHFSELAQLESGSEAYIAKAKAIGALQGKAIAQGLIDRASIQKQVMDLLTPEQVQKFQVMSNKMIQKRASHMDNHYKKGDHSN